MRLFLLLAFLAPFAFLPVNPADAASPPPLLAAPTAASTSAPTTRIASPAAWITSAADELKLTPTPETDNTYGFDYLFLDRQLNVREQSSYTRTVYRITNAGSLQSGARVSWDYDPAHTTLTVHHIRVIRNGITEDRLKPGSLQTIQQERDYDRHLYDGRLTSFMVLEDIRVGDIIDFAATRTGWNPVFEGRLITHYGLRYGSPLRHQTIRILCPSDRTFGAKTIGDTAAAIPVKFSKEKRGADTLYTWESGDLPPITAEDGAPGWFTQYPWLQMSEYSDWASVIRWAEPLYALPDPLPEPLATKARELTQNIKNDSDKAIALLEFVQQEIRYLGVELGTGSYRPNAPEIVLTRRFGDCKDKSLLFCALMRAIGLTAYPALVDTTDARALENRLPSPGVFNHVIAYIPKSAAGGDIVSNTFVDPTITDQQGDLRHRALPEYELALVIRHGGTRLSTIPVVESATRSVRVNETYDSAAFDKPTALSVTIAYTGLTADGVRTYLRENTIDDVSKFYFNDYASLYPGITTVPGTPIRWKDDTKSNTLTIEATYSIPNFWSVNDEKTQWEGEVYPKRIATGSQLPDTSKRTTPLAMGSAFFLEVTNTVNLPAEWNITPSVKTYDSPGFSAKIERRHPAKNQFVLITAWKVSANNVTPADMPGYIETLKKFRNNLGSTLTHPIETKTTASTGQSEPAKSAPAPAYHYRFNWLFVFVAFAVVLICAWIGRLLYRAPAVPPPLQSTIETDLVGLGGWLILVAVGICISPFALIVTTIKVALPMFNLDIWENLTIPGAAAYQPLWGFALISEYVMNLILVVTSVVLLVFFFKKKRRFAAVFIFLLAFSAFAQIADIFMIQQLVIIEQTSQDQIRGIGGLVGAILRALIWISYALTSRRVKYTFTQ